MRRQLVLTYVLSASGEPVAEPDFDAWLVWRHRADTAEAIRVANTTVHGVLVTTVFTGICEVPEDEHEPHPLWETRIWTGLWADRAYRWRSRQRADEGHAEVVAMVRLIESRRARNGKGPAV